MDFQLGVGGELLGVGLRKLLEFFNVFLQLSQQLVSFLVVILLDVQAAQNAANHQFFYVILLRSQSHQVQLYLLIDVP